MKFLSQVVLDGDLRVGAPMILRCAEHTNRLQTTVVQHIEETEYGFRVQTRNNLYDLYLARDKKSYNGVTTKPNVMLGSKGKFVVGTTWYETDGPVVSVLTTQKGTVLYTRTSEYELIYEK